MIGCPVVCGPRVTFRNASFYTLKSYGFHFAIDIYAPEGSPIYSPTNGTIERRTIQPTRAGGFEQLIRGLDGETHFMSHCQHACIPAVGERVYTGQLINHVGKTGNAPTPHCHYRTRDAQGRIYNPFRGLAAQQSTTRPLSHVGPVPCPDGPRIIVAVNENDYPQDRFLDEARARADSPDRIASRERSADDSERDNDGMSDIILALATAYVTGIV